MKEWIGDFRKNRVEFKLYACEKIIEEMKRLKKKHDTLWKRDVIADTEILIDCFFAEIIGAIDAFLGQINDRLNLGLDIKEVGIDNVQIKLNGKNKGKLLKELNKAKAPNNWLWLLFEYRNHTIHRSVIPTHLEITARPLPKEFSLLENPHDPNSKPMDKTIIPYFEESVANVRQLIESIRKKDPMLMR